MLFLMAFCAKAVSDSHSNFFPFGRNEVWRYNRRIWGSEAFRRADFILYGWKYALPMLIVTAFYEVYVNKDSHGHGHGDHGDHGHAAEGHH